MKYKEYEVLDIIKSCTTEDPGKILLDWNNKKANTPLDLKKWHYPYFVYSFPVVIEDKKVATVTLVSCWGTGLSSQKDDLMQKYFGHEEYENSYWTFSHDTYLDCYLTVHQEFELPKIVKGFSGQEFKSEDAEGNEFRFTVSLGYPEKEDEVYIWKQYINGECYRFDSDLNIQILDKIQKGWLLGAKINENIEKRKTISHE